MIGGFSAKKKFPANHGQVRGPQSAKYYYITSNLNGVWYIDRLMQDYSISIANAQEIAQFLHKAGDIFCYKNIECLIIYIPWV